MKKFPQLSLLLLFATVVLMVSGCGVHNVPQSDKPFQLRGNKVTVQVDQFGAYYPNGWKEEVGDPQLFAGYSLELRAKKGGKTEFLSRGKEKIVSDFTSFIQGKDRLIIFVHGYNNGECEATAAYNEITKTIRTSGRDAIVHFFWDGLVSRAWVLGDARIWFYAAGNSHLAGTKGLRPLLAQAHGKEIVMVTHSRGAHVALSALSNPRVSRSFAADTNRIFGRNMFADAPLPNNGNSIKLLFISPAIGRVDFRNPDHADNGSFRSLGPQVKMLAHTINPKDRVLKKFIGGVSDNFNSTDFGHDVRLANELKCTYPFLAHRFVYNLKSHNFTKNALHPAVRDLFVMVGLQPIEAKLRE